MVLHPTTGQWSLYYAQHSDGTSGDASLLNSPVGSAIDNVLTGASLPFIGCFWSHNTTTNDFARFDNFKVPYDCSTIVELGTVAITTDGYAGSILVPVTITNPSSVNATHVDLVLISGNPGRVANFSSATIDFPAGSSSTKFLELPISEDGGCVGDELITLHLQNLVGGQGVPTIGPAYTLMLTIVDNEVSRTQLLNEGFETDGAGERYELSTPYDVPAMNSYLLRSTATGFAGAGGIAVSGQEGNSYFGAENLGAIAPNAEAMVTFGPFDILGTSGLTLDLLAAARASSQYDRLSADKDYLLVETKVDAGGWNVIGAFRPMGPEGSSNRRLALDANLDGEGDGAPMGSAMTNYTFPVTSSGDRIMVRLRFRTTAV
ncbi:MAG TPA: hypothetical protein PK760_14840, partial [Flavobacteriales bacterium]|nr:hypothetical protein [Flavobacteriales bacterium]